MRILSLVNEGKLFMGTYPVRELFFSDEDYEQLIRNISAYHSGMEAETEDFGYCMANAKKTSLFGKKVEILGFGRIKKKLSTLLKPFGVNIIIYDPFASEKTAEENRKKCGLKEFLSCIDLLALMAKLHEGKKHIINEQTFRIHAGGCVNCKCSPGAPDRLRCPGQVA